MRRRAAAHGGARPCSDATARLRALSRGMVVGLRDSLPAMHAHAMLAQEQHRQRRQPSGGVSAAAAQATAAALGRMAASQVTA